MPLEAKCSCFSSFTYLYISSKSYMYVQSISEVDRIWMWRYFLNSNRRIPWSKFCKVCIHHSCVCCRKQPFSNRNFHFWSSLQLLVVLMSSVKVFLRKAWQICTYSWFDVYSLRFCGFCFWNFKYMYYFVLKSKEASFFLRYILKWTDFY